MREEVLNVLKSVREDVDFENETKLIDDGILDSFDIISIVSELNEKFYAYADSHENFYINDINYLSACYGLDKWADPFFWHMYKYALCLDAIPNLAFNVSNIIKSIYGKNKK